jgi:exocyst complex protein 7
MYECVNESIPLIETMFAGETSDNLRFDALAILSRLGDAAWGTLVEFEDEVQHETSKTAVPTGEIHRTTRYVMNYMSFLCEYSDTMNQILSDRVGDSSDHHRDDSDRGPFSEIMLRFLQHLEGNLEAKSKLYKDMALANLFLMNNLHYISQKVKGSEVVRKLVGDEWIRRNNGKLSQYHVNYRRIAWAKVLSCLKDEGITVSGGVVSNSSRNILKEKFKSFNAAFEENIRTQSNWVVKDPQLCSELQISVAGMLLPAYRSFHGRFKIHMDAVKHSERYVKYSPEDVETYLNDLFEGAPGSLNRRRSFPASGNTV